MDWIVVLLIIIGAVSRSNKKKKEAQARSQQKWQAAAEAMAESRAPKGKVPPKVREEITGFVKELGSDLIDNGVPTLTEAVREIRDAMPKKPAAPVHMPRRAEPAPAPVQASGSMAYQPAAFTPMQPQRLETLQAEGETHAEHAAHVARIHAGEQAMAAARTRQEVLRGMDLKKLRAAVVMGEVLGKPVSMRPGGRFR